MLVSKDGLRRMMQLIEDGVPCNVYKGRIGDTHGYIVVALNEDGSESKEQAKEMALIIRDDGHNRLKLV